MKQQIKGYTLVFFCRGNCLNTLVYRWFCMTCFNADEIFFLIVVLPYMQTCSLCLCFIQSNFKPFACFEGSGNTPLFHIALVNCVGSYPVSFFWEKAKCFSSFFFLFCVFHFAQEPMAGILWSDSAGLSDIVTLFCSCYWFWSLRLVWL